MEEKNEVLFGHSFSQPDTIIVEKVWRVGFFEDEEGNQLGPEYNADAESWMARTDMSCVVFPVSKASLDTLTKKYTDFIKASWEECYDKLKVERLKKEFLIMVNE